MASSGARYPELAGRAAVVTGAGRGLGEAQARALVRHGVSVVAGDIDLGLVTETARRINAEPGTVATVVPARIDVTSPGDHHVLAELAQQRFGRLDHWINNAGIFPEAGVRSINPEQLGTTFGTNVNGVLFGGQAAVAAMDGRGGSVVNMASIAAFTVRKERASYGASKAAVEHLTRFLAVELGPPVLGSTPSPPESSTPRWRAGSMKVKRSSRPPWKLFRCGGSERLTLQTRRCSSFLMPLRSSRATRLWSTAAAVTAKHF